MTIPTLFEQSGFEEFHLEHPEIFESFVARALALKRAGVDHYGAKAIIEVMRYQSALDGRPAERWKLNNDYTARYARLAMIEFPELRGFFATRGG